VTKDELVDAVIAEVERVFAPDGFDGEQPQYEWLEKTYGISEEDDVKWQFILEQDFDEEDRDELDPADENDAEMLAFLADEPAVMAFLENILAKYRAHDAVWPRK
jgi:hypothetical protein